MGYTTYFEGSVSIEPPLSPKEITYINAFAASRRMGRANGDYYVDGNKSGFNEAPDVYDINRPPEGQPGLWCQWVASEDGTELEWDGGEKFYAATEWMEYIINHFLGSDPIAKKANENFDFLEGHILNGEIYAEGEDSDDRWKIEVKNNVVTQLEGEVEITYK